MSQTKFVHLHLHSEYSLLDGACRLSELPQRVKQCGQDAVALTDHGVLYGAVAFDRICRENGVHPVLGCEVYVATGSRFDKTVGEKYHHLVLLCKNNEGYKNLCKMVSLGFTEGFYSRPRVDEELLKTYHEGLIALSACIGGKIPQQLLNGDWQGAEETAKKYADIFGKDNFYIEIQNHRIAEEKKVLPQLVTLAKKLGLPLVATNDCHYLRGEDAEKQHILMCIQTGTNLSDGRPEAFATDEFYVKSTEAMELLFSAYPDALENTAKIAERCNVEFDYSTTYLPKFPIPTGETAEEYLSRLACDGYAKRKANGTLVLTETNTEKVYSERMEYELSVIDKMGYADYFLIVQDYVNYAKSHGISVGPGRGSGAGSLVAFCLGITDIDPLRYDLLFERFLNPERVSMPDIDIDFCDRRREEMIVYAREKYGADRVSQIITFGTLSARAVIRDVGRVLGMPYGDVDTVAKKIPQELNITIDKALQDKDFLKLYTENEEVKRLVDLAKGLEGMPRNASIHAAGVVITDKPVTDYVPLATSNGVPVTQYDMDTIAKLGLLKFDFLALRYLTILQDAEEAVKETEPTFSQDTIPLEDEATYRLISSGKTSGIFQLESGGMRSMLTSLSPDKIDDIIAAIALYRPGPMDYIPAYIQGHKHPETVTYAHPLLEPILKSTYGVIVYQEQVMQIFRVIGGYTFGHADIVRRAMSKKKKDVLLSEKKAFLEGAEKNGVEKAVAEKLFSDMEAFANYAFNKSHAAAYGVLSYRTAYLKAHYPQAYFSALLTSVFSRADKVAEYITECNQLGIQVLSPDINHSQITFAPEGENIRFGLLALKNVGVAFLTAVIRERNRGKFVSFEDFTSRMSKEKANRRMTEALICAGCFDGMGHNRRQMMTVCEEMLEAGAERVHHELEGQMDLFSDSDGGAMVEVAYPDVEEYSKKELLRMEKDATGFCFSGSFLEDYENQLKDLKLPSIASLLESHPEDKKNLRFAGILADCKVKTTKNGGKMATAKVEDSTGDLECILFDRTYQSEGQYLVLDSGILVEGTVSYRDEEKPQILVRNLTPLADNTHYQPTPKKQKLYLRFPTQNDVPNLMFSKGTTELYYYYNDTKQYEKRPTSIAVNEILLGQLKKMLGEENVVLK